eukprot:Nitzschia sp. Nitz4//scaffold26_size159584//69121//69825//NITZ4_002489-RA/size159584-snap-gene-0.31-mRNA-1//-1//CDS//3329545076//7933//frame0
MAVPLETKVLAFRVASATIYLLVALSCFHYAMSGFMRFFLGLPLCLLATVMLTVQLGAMLGPSASMALAPLEQLRTPNGETVFTYQGRLLVDGLLALCLIGFLGRWFYAIALIVLAGCIVAFKEQENELFDEVFRSSGSEGGVSSSGGAGGDWAGGYQTVES